MKNRRWLFYVEFLVIPAIPYLLMLYYPQAIDAVVGFFSTHRAALLAVPIYMHGWGLWVLHAKVPATYRMVVLFSCGAVSLCLLVLMAVYFNISRWSAVTVFPIVYFIAANILDQKAAERRA